MTEKSIDNSVSEAMFRKELNIEVFLLCYNEEKIIRHSLNYYKTICNKITVLDNESTDSTLAIIAKEYPDVEVMTFKTENKMRDDIHMFIKNTCWKESKADWCIVADMDELLYHESIFQELYLRKKNLQSLPVVEGYNMFSETFNGNYDQLITEQLHYGIRDTNFDKFILICPTKVKKIMYGPGAHTVGAIQLKDKFLKRRNDQKGYKVNNAFVKFNNFKLLHYKYLGEAYLIEKHKRLAERLSQQNKDSGWCWEYEKGEEEIKARFKFLRESGKVKKVI